MFVLNVFFVLTTLICGIRSQGEATNSMTTHLDIAFIMDTTGSMGPYIETARNNIKRVVQEITEISESHIRFALIEYRDHKPEENTYVYRKQDFTPSVTTMQSWLEKSEANGGGDLPEAVAVALYAGSSLSWYDSAVKIAVLIADAPPHGLVSSGDRWPDGDPLGIDPVKMAYRMARIGITLYSVGCEPSILPYKDFFQALAYIAGGQYVPLSTPQALIDAIIGGAKEELAMRKISEEVDKEVSAVKAKGGKPERDAITRSVYDRLHKSGTKATTLLKNNKPLAGPSKAALEIAKSKSLPEAKKIFAKMVPGGSGSPPVSPPVSEVYTAVERPVSYDQVSRAASKAFAASA
ncbi:uncharacterized protein LOC127858606 [Dreissena polymorpha]|uniref:VWFA domain-containing protein n=1 Tax=Dreissena polymorpha TaxID=45954 RepID=A0A9D4DF72_DREPO|nr:uncharacterized protein LOC127858606 [Dreissena polymorpha]KAH3712519.1 hypothetical protein DPMN_072270 [Dreissena polymorpha]KAH3748502.1 hypothetical protein DPMN_182948 [Dreissena polymorpha]